MVVAISLALGVLAACLAGTPSVARAGPFDTVDQLDTKLVRGQSTMDDVRHLLGKPKGKGGGRFPPAWAPLEIWQYEEIVIHHNMWNPETRNGQLQADAEARQLLVLFRDGRFAGYLWYGMRVEGDDLP